jgi:alpha-maltose-1-phosphate synthase
MKILAVIIIPPHLQVSGAVNAAKALSLAITEYCDVDIAIMSDRECTSALGNANLFERRSTNPLQFTQGFLPNKFRTLLYQSDIPLLIKRGNYDLIHLHNPIPSLEMKRVAKACVDQSIPYVISTHGFVEVLNKDRAYSLNLFERMMGTLLIDYPLKYVLEHAEMIFALSPNEYPMFEEIGIPKSKLVVVTNGVSLSRPADSRVLEQVTQRFNLLPPESKLQNKRPLIGFYLGNHTRNKGIQVLLDALQLVEVPYLFIIGGKKRSEIDYHRYEQASTDEQKIVFTDFLTDDEVIALHGYADLFVFPTLADTLPLVVLEAMAQGTPVLSTYVGGIPYQLDESCGFLIPPNDPGSLARAIENAANDLDHLARMGDNAIHKVEQRFTWTSSAKEAYDFYCHILNVHQS